MYVCTTYLQIERINMGLVMKESAVGNIIYFDHPYVTWDCYLR